MHRNRRSSAVACLLTATAALSLAPAAARGDRAPLELLVNGKFDGSLSGWESVGLNRNGWVPMSHDANPNSGAGRISPQSDSGAGLRQCVQVVGGQPYVFESAVWLQPAAIALDAEMTVAFNVGAHCDGSPTGSVVAESVTTTGAWDPLVWAEVAPAAAHSAYVGVVLFGQGTAFLDDASFHRGACEPGLAALCLAGERFHVKTIWLTPDNKIGLGRTVPFTADSGSFWFFDPSNIEVNVKVLDACAINGKYWVYASGSTTVAVTLEVIDTATGATKQYTNPQGRAFQTVTDIAAFGNCPPTAR